MKKKILVIGDVICDEYIYGRVSRISPEAPIPVIKAQNETTKILGGAANVANNLAELDNQVSVMSVLGNDVVGHDIISLMKNKGIDTSLMRLEDAHFTLHKIRIVGNNQQIVRIDYNDEQRPKKSHLEKMLANIEHIITEYDIVIISDYGKGMCTEFVCKTVIHNCNILNIPVIVDPKGVAWDKYAGSTIITPNMKEVSDYLNITFNNTDVDIEKYCKDVFVKLEIENLLVTRSEFGMSLITLDGQVTHYPVRAKEVFDVSGAGDTVVAALASYLEKDISNLGSAVEISNIAAGIVVAKAGTATVTRKEIQTAIALGYWQFHAPIFDVNDLELVSKLVNEWKQMGFKVVTTNGCFDILHRGHIQLIHEAKKMGDKLIIGINADASVKRIKGDSRPINMAKDRAYALAAMKDVDAVAIFDEHIQGDENSDAPMTLLKTIHPTVHVKGGDYNLEQVPEAAFADVFSTVNFVDGYSSSKIIMKAKGI